MASCEVKLPEPQETGQIDADPPLATYPLVEEPTVAIEFCDRCRWLHRATWLQTELFLTFPPPAIASITLFPRNAEDTGGRFRVWIATQNDRKLVWDRKTEGGFPELKVLKQRIRDMVQPGRTLGHSDKGS